MDKLLEAILQRLVLATFPSRRLLVRLQPSIGSWIFTLVGGGASDAVSVFLAAQQGVFGLFFWAARPARAGAHVVGGHAADGASSSGWGQSGAGVGCGGRSSRPLAVGWAVRAGGRWLRRGLFLSCRSPTIHTSLWSTSPSRWLPGTTHKQPFSRVTSSRATQAVARSIGSMWKYAES